MQQKKIIVTALGLAVAAIGGVAIAQSNVPGRAGMDANKDGVIDRAEAAKYPRLAERFDALDINKDGKLSADERPMGGKGMRGGRGMQGGPGGMQRPTFESLDANKDGKVTQQEMQAAHATRMAERQQQMQSRFEERFKAMDANGDGNITRAEMQAAHAKRMGENQAQRASMFADHFKRMDSNGDGSLSKSEFEARRGMKPKR